MHERYRVFSDIAHMIRCVSGGTLSKICSYFSQLSKKVLDDLLLIQQGFIGCFFSEENIGFLTCFLIDYVQCTGYEKGRKM